MHDIPPHQPDTRHPLAQRLDQAKDRARAGSTRQKIDLARDSFVEPSAAARARN